MTTVDVYDMAEVRVPGATRRRLDVRLARPWKR
jgi:hypothetical protein